jgi:hypothetical protein
MPPTWRRRPDEIPGCELRFTLVHQPGIHGVLQVRRPGQPGHGTCPGRRSHACRYGRSALDSSLEPDEYPGKAPVRSAQHLGQDDRLATSKRPAGAPKLRRECRVGTPRVRSAGALLSGLDIAIAIRRLSLPKPVVNSLPAGVIMTAA